MEGKVFIVLDINDGTNYYFWPSWKNSFSGFDYKIMGFAGNNQKNSFTVTYFTIPENISGEIGPFYLWTIIEKSENDEIISNLFNIWFLIEGN